MIKDIYLPKYDDDDDIYLPKYDDDDKRYIFT